MRAKQVLFDTLRSQGVDYVFGNPGTTESPLIDGLIEAEWLTYILTLQESIALGAASYYAQSSGRTGFVNLHVAPGLGNALGMLYNAWEAGSPLVVTAGQTDSRLRLREPLLSHDLVRMAEPLVKWSAQVERADELALVLHRAFKIANDPPAGPVFVALPWDVLEQETEQAAMPPTRLYAEHDADQEGVAAAAEMLVAARSPALVVGDGAAGPKARVALLELAEALGAPVFSAGLLQHLSVASQHPVARLRMPFDMAGIRHTLADADVIVLVGGSFFEEVWYGSGGFFPADAKIVQIEAAAERVALNFAVDVGLVGAPGVVLDSVCQRVRAAGGAELERQATLRLRQLEHDKAEGAAQQRAREQKGWNSEPISVPRLMAELADCLPDDAILVEEAITAGVDLMRRIDCKPGAFYGNRGGGIGQALPGAIGTSLASPDRPVVAISGDGSAMYTIQALWTAAHHRLGILFVVLHNREYRILKHNMEAYRRQFGIEADRPYQQMDLHEPPLDFVALARGQGVDASAVSAPDRLAAALLEGLAFASSGRPYLLDVSIEGLG